ncbi:MAG: histidine triad nucleotide-binding protein [Verrucomicrobia bacterium]|nr:histidine triad nucleotide-binding protein [Verrucomicrobiota bacterium]
MPKTIFERIVDREAQADILYEDEHVLAFPDIAPQAPVHILLIPKRHHARHAAVPPEHHSVFSHLFAAAQKVARQLRLEKNGYRLVMNNGPDGGETVPHLHLHLLGGRPLSWPPG